MDFEDSELLETFIEEAREYLVVLNAGLLALERSGSDESVIHSVFRAAHSLKGNAALIGIDDIKILSHSLESVFDAIRDGTITYSGQMYDTVFKTVDKLSFMVDQVVGGEAVTKDYSPLVSGLKNFTEPMLTAPEESKEESRQDLPGSSKEEPDEFGSEQIVAFCEDTIEVITSIGEDLLSLEKTPKNTNLTKSIGNRLHSLAGGASFLNLESVSGVSSSLEELLSLTLTHSPQLAGRWVDFFERMSSGVELLKHMLDSLLTGTQSAPDCDLWLTNIKKLSREIESGDKTTTPTEPYDKAPQHPEATSVRPEPGKPGKRGNESIRVNAQKLDDTIKLMGEMVSNFGLSKQRFALLREAEKLSKKTLKHLTSVLSDSQSLGQPLFSKAKGLMGILAIEEKLLEPAQVVNILYTQKTTSLRFGEAAVSLGYLNNEEVKKLMGLQKFHKTDIGVAEELKEVKKRIKEITRTAEFLDQTVKKIVASEKEEQLIEEVLTNDLKENALKMRMLPLSTLFNTFARFVRDTAKVVNKSVLIEIAGGETELDRKMIEKLGDPLIHMIRNSIDHGIEAPETRQKLKKNVSGTIRISGKYDGGNILIEFSDDGKGIDPENIVDKALKRGLFSAEELKEMNDDQIINLIFHPGFSTTDKVSDISGRGVGLDVVKKNIVEELKGAIEISTVEGRGTTFSLRLPITLALIKVLNIKVAEHQFSIPLTYIREIINIPRSALISLMDKTAFMLNDSLVNIINLADILGVANPSGPRSNILLLLVKLGTEIVGFSVDAIIGEENTVIKPLPPHMKNFHLVSGVRISAENEIVNILNIPNILKLARNSKIVEHFHTESPQAARDQLQKILVVDDSEMALKHQKKILEVVGYNVDTASDAFEGINMAKEFKYDLVITDIEMPGKDGFTFTHELRRQDAYKNVPVIVSSSLDKDKFRRRAKEVGASGYIVKKDFSADSVSNILKTLSE